MDTGMYGSDFCIVKFPTRSFISHSPPINLVRRVELDTFSWDNVLQKGLMVIWSLKCTRKMQSCPTSHSISCYYLLCLLLHPHPCRMHWTRSHRWYGLKLTCRKRKGANLSLPTPSCQSSCAQIHSDFASTEREVVMGNQKAVEDRIID